MKPQPPIDRIGQLSRWLEGTDIALLELCGPGVSIRLQRAAIGSQAAGPAPMAGAPDPACVVRAGSAGVLLWTHPLRTEPLASVGQQVQAGQAVALLQLGQVLLGVHAPQAGRIRRIAAQHRQAVGWGEALLEIAQEQE